MKIVHRFYLPGYDEFLRADFIIAIVTLLGGLLFFMLPMITIFPSADVTINTFGYDAAQIVSMIKRLEETKCRVWVMSLPMLFGATITSFAAIVIYRLRLNNYKIVCGK